MAEYDRHYDTAVIGAGPAGAVFAAALGRLRPDLRILVIDGQTEENKKVCGGLLAPDAQRVLAEMGLTLPNAVLADPQIFAVDTNDLVSGQRCVYQRHYLNMDRYAFDRWLVSMIPDHITVLSGRCERLERTGGIFTLRVNGAVFTAATIVGADGAHSTVRRTFIGQMPKQYAAIQERYPDRGQQVPSYACIFDPQTSDSCSWTIRKDGYLIFGGAFDKHGCHGAFAAQKRRLEEHLGCSLGEPQMREACLVTSPRRWSDICCGIPGVYLIGEAGGFLSASSFEGISSAMLCGKYLAQAFADGTSKEDILRRYKRLTCPLRLKLWTKTWKRAVLCAPVLRYLIMKSGVQSVSVTQGWEELLHEAE